MGIVSGIYAFVVIAVTIKTVKINVTFFMLILSMFIVLTPHFLGFEDLN